MGRVIQHIQSLRLAPDLGRGCGLGDLIAREVVPKISTFIQRRVFDSGKAEEVIQETLRGVARALEKFSGDSDSQFWALCYQIARNQIANVAREKAAPLDFVDPGILESLARACEPEANKPSNETPSLDSIISLLNEEDPEACQFAYAYYVLEIGWVELAKQAGRTPDAIRVKVRRALEAIAPRLEEIYENER